jgi:hypothetical protein
MRRRAPRLVLLAAAALLGACSLIPADDGAPAAVPAAERTDPSLRLIGEHLQRMQRLSQGSPAEQAEIFQSARDGAELSPTTQNRLGYALALATPGHGATDPQLAHQQLSALLAAPETLLPAERALAGMVLQNVEQRLILQAENQRLQTELADAQRQRTAANGRRLQAELEENARLRKALQEAQAKLDEIARIERSLTERAPPPK